MGRCKVPIEERIMKKVIVTDGCWGWTGHKDASGAGRICFEGKNKVAYRFYYQMKVGPVKEGLFLDHICRNRECIRPDHLRQVTPHFNAVMNSTSRSALNAVKTHCSRGHEFNEENTTIYLYRGNKRRICRPCTRINAKSQHERLKNEKQR